MKKGHIKIRLYQKKYGNNQNNIRSLKTKTWTYIIWISKDIEVINLPQSNILPESGGKFAKSANPVGLVCSKIYFSLPIKRDVLIFILIDK